MTKRTLNPAGHQTDAYAPVAIYTYSRVEHFIQTVESLRNNYLADQTILYVVSDGPKCEDHKPKIEAIRNYAEDLHGFREVVKIFRPSNLGMQNSPPMAEKQILHDHGKIINMEDDNVTSPNYLDFMNSALSFFEDDETIYSVCGYCPPVGPEHGKVDADFWRYPWNLSWGYGVWKSKHDRFHPLINRYPEHRRSGLLQRQNSAGGLYVSDSLKRDFKGLKYFPDAIIGTEMFSAGMHCIVPTISKVYNTGQDGSGQSTLRTTNKYAVALDTGEQRVFNFDCESSHGGIFRNGARQFYNGSLATRTARALGIYHYLSEWRDKIFSNSAMTK